MNNKEKILKLISGFIEKGILTSEDVKKEILNNFKFKKDDIISRLKLVSREEHEILKKIVLKQEREISKLKKKKKL
ncbi:accessory factor UbiK family protein [Pelagibacteraceae bacterium]|nr:accessory factor UbiK family protein [Pelagibacteraceae bacterium]